MEHRSCVIVPTNTGRGRAGSGSRLKTSSFKFLVRLPESMRSHIEAAAKAARRSMNSEIVARLEQSFQGLPAVHEPPPNREVGGTDLPTPLSPDELDLIHRYRLSSGRKRSALRDLLD